MRNQVPVNKAWLETLLKMNKSLKEIADKLEMTPDNYMLISQICVLTGYISSAEIILKTND